MRAADEYQLARLTIEQEETHWLGTEPADEPTLVAAEQRLGIRFPPSLRAFLSVTNGWHGVGGWIEQVSGCEGIDWLRNTDTGDYLIGIYDDDDEMVALFRRTLAVAAGEDLWLLDPTETGPDGEWTAYEFAPKYGDYSEYASFADLFHESREQI